MNARTFAALSLLLRLLARTPSSSQRHHLWQPPAAGDKVRPTTRTEPRPLLRNHGEVLHSQLLICPRQDEPPNVPACLSSALFPTGALKTPELSFPPPQVFSPTGASVFVSATHGCVIQRSFLDQIIWQ